MSLDPGWCWGMERKNTLPNVLKNPCYYPNGYFLIYSDTDVLKGENAETESQLQKDQPGLSLQRPVAICLPDASLCCFSHTLTLCVPGNTHNR